MVRSLSMSRPANNFGIAVTAEDFARLQTALDVIDAAEREAIKDADRIVVQGL